MKKPLVAANLTGPTFDSRHSTMTSGLGTACDAAEADTLDRIHVIPETEDLEANLSDCPDVTKKELTLDVDLDEHHMSDLLKRLVDDAELHKLLSDERMRCELHRSNYVKLKAEYLRMLHNSQKLESQCAAAETEKSAMAEASRAAGDQLEREVQALQAKIESLQSRVPTEAERISLEQELRSKHEALWKSRIAELVDDLEASKLTVHNMMHENLSLRLSLHHMSDETKRLVDEAKLQVETQLDRLGKENKELHQQHEPKLKAAEECANQMKSDNAKLRHKVRFLEEQLQDRQSCGSEAEKRLTRLGVEMANKESRYAIAIKKLEAELESLQLHCHKLESILTAEKLKSNEQSSLVKSYQNDISRLKDQVAEARAERESALAKMKLDCVSARSGLECEVDSLKLRLRETENKAKLLESDLEMCQKDMEKRQLQHEQGLQQCRVEHSKKEAQIDTRLGEVLEKYKLTQKQLASERIQRQQAEREQEASVGILERKSQEADLLKALVGKLQKHGRGLQDHKTTTIEDETMDEQKDQLVEPNEARLLTLKQKSKEAKLPRDIEVVPPNAELKRKGFAARNSNKSKEEGSHSSPKKDNKQHGSKAERTHTEDYQMLKRKYDDLQAKHTQFAQILQKVPSFEQKRSSSNKIE